ncbi:MAG: hypothetical protein EOO03_05305, partial [Chitinophagaceae bacterium]
MRLSKLAFLLSFCTLFFSNAFSQTPEEGIDFLRQEYSAENVFIHFDKDVYVAGETVWFKAYILAGEQPSPYSTSIHVELLSDSGKTIDTNILPVFAGAAVGSFPLDRNATPKTYTVRAFTKRMMNFGASYFYEKRLQVLSPVALPVTAANVSAYNISFLPEGGNIVGGVPAVVAFKASNEFGEPVAVDGDIIDSKGNAVVSFSAVHDGMGKFIFLPQPGEQYHAVYNINQRKDSVSLPAVNVSGITMLMQDNAVKRSFIINREKLASEAMNPAYLLGVQNNMVRFKIELPKKTLLIKGEIPEKDLSPG